LESTCDHINRGVSQGLEKVFLYAIDGLMKQVKKTLSGVTFTYRHLINHSVSCIITLASQEIHLVDTSVESESYSVCFCEWL
jgi:hypothetical protein